MNENEFHTSTSNEESDGDYTLEHSEQGKISYIMKTWKASSRQFALPHFISIKVHSACRWIWSVGIEDSFVTLAFFSLYFLYGEDYIVMLSS
jgi:hypothetical protein